MSHPADQLAKLRYLRDQRDEWIVKAGEYEDAGKPHMASMALRNADHYSEKIAQGLGGDAA